MTKTKKGRIMLRIIAFLLVFTMVSPNITTAALIAAEDNGYTIDEPGEPGGDTGSYSDEGQSMEGGVESDQEVEEEVEEYPVYPEYPTYPDSSENDDPSDENYYDEENDEDYYDYDDEENDEEDEEDDEDYEDEDEDEEDEDDDRNANLPSIGGPQASLTNVRIFFPEDVTNLFEDIWGEISIESVYYIERGEIDDNFSLFDGVYAIDELFRPAEVFIFNDGGFNLSPSLTYNYFTIIYGGIHPETSEIFTRARTVALSPSEMADVEMQIFFPEDSLDDDVFYVELDFAEVNDELEILYNLLDGVFALIEDDEAAEVFIIDDGGFDPLAIYPDIYFTVIYGAVNPFTDELVTRERVVAPQQFEGFARLNAGLTDKTVVREINVTAGGNGTGANTLRWAVAQAAGTNRGPDEWVMININVNTTLNGTNGSNAAGNPNGQPGGPGLMVSGNVIFNINTGVTLNITGGNGGSPGTATAFGSSHRRGGDGGVGISLASGANFAVLGEGILNARGGNGGNGGWRQFNWAYPGGHGGDAIHIPAGSSVEVYFESVLNPSGGNGGNGASAVGLTPGRGGDGGFAIHNDGLLTIMGSINVTSSAGGGGTRWFGANAGPGNAGGGIRGNGQHNQHMADYSRVDYLIAIANNLNRPQFVQSDLDRLDDAIAAVARGLTRDLQYQVDAMADAIQYALDRLGIRTFSVVFTVQNGIWSTNNDETYTVVVEYGQTLGSRIPQSIPNAGFASPGAWDIAPNPSAQITDNMDFTYRFTEILRHAVRFHMNYNNSSEPVWREETVNHGERLSISVPEPTRLGHDFIGWGATSNALTALPYEVIFGDARPVITEDVNYYAMWRVRSYTVTFAIEGADEIDVPGSVTVPFGTPITLPTLNHDGFILTNLTWSGNAQGSSFVVEDNATLTLTVEESNRRKFTVFFEIRGTDGYVMVEIPAPASMQARFGRQITLPEVTHHGFDLEGLMWNGTHAQDVLFTVENNMTFVLTVPETNRREFTVTFAIEGADEIDVPAAITRPYGYNIPLPILNHNGFNLEDLTWSGYAQGSFFTVEDDVTLTLTVEEANRRMFFVDFGVLVRNLYDPIVIDNGIIPHPETMQARFGRQITLPAVSHTGFYLEGLMWNDEFPGLGLTGNEFAQGSRFTVTGDVTLYMDVLSANRRDFTVTFAIEGADEIDVPLPITVPFGTIATLPILSHPGFDLTGLTWSGYGQDSFPFLTVTEDVTLTMVVPTGNRREFTVFFQVLNHEGDAVYEIPAPASVREAFGTGITLPTLTHDGFNLTGLEWNGEFAQGSNFTVTEDIILTITVPQANRIYHTVTFAIQGADEIDVPAQVIRLHGTQIALPILNHYGFDLTGLTWSGYAQGSNFIMTEDVTLTMVVPAESRREFTVFFQILNHEGDAVYEIPAPASVREAFGTVIPLPILTHTGFDLAGLEWNGQFAQGSNFTVTENITLSITIPQANRIYRTVTFAIEGADEIDVPAAITRLRGTQIFLPTLSHHGFDLTGLTWSEYAQGSSFTITEDVTLTMEVPHENREYFTVTFIRNQVNDDATVIGTISVPFGTELSDVVAGADFWQNTVAYRFNGWSTSRTWEFEGTDFDAIVDSNMYMYGRWLSRYQLLFFVENGTWDENDGTSYQFLLEYGDALEAGNIPTPIANHGFVQTGGRWIEEVGSAGTPNVGMSIANSRQPRTIIFRYVFEEREDFTVTFEIEGADEIDVPGPVTVPFGTQITLPTLNHDGFNLEGLTWSGYAQGSSFAVEDNVILTLTVEESNRREFTVFFQILDHNGETVHEIPAIAPAREIFGTVIELPTLDYHTGFDLEGLEWNGEYAQGSDFTVTQSMTLAIIIPQANRIYRTVTFVINGADEIDIPAAITRLRGTQIFLPTLSHHGFDLTGLTWSEYAQGSSFIMTEDVTLTMEVPEENRVLFDVSFVLNEENGSNPDNVVIGVYSVPFGTRLGDIAPTSAFDEVTDSLRFNGWSRNSDWTYGYTDFDAPVVSNMNKYARWTARYQITFQVTNGTWDENGDTSHVFFLDYGDVLEEADIPMPIADHGFVQAGGQWVGDAPFAGKAVNDSTQPNTFVFNFNFEERHDFIVSFNANGGTVNAESISVPFEGTLNSVGAALPMPVRNGHIFMGWTAGSAGGAAFTASTQILDNVVAFANWVSLNDVINVTPAGLNLGTGVAGQFAVADHTHTVTVTNNHTTGLQFAIELYGADAASFALGTNIINVPAGQSAEFTVAPASAALAAGQYEASVRVVLNGDIAAAFDVNFAVVSAAPGGGPDFDPEPEPPTPPPGGGGTGGGDTGNGGDGNNESDDDAVNDSETAETTPLFAAPAPSAPAPSAVDSAPAPAQAGLSPPEAPQQSAGAPEFGPGVPQGASGAPQQGAGDPQASAGNPLTGDNQSSLGLIVSAAGLITSLGGLIFFIQSRRKRDADAV